MEERSYLYDRFGARRSKKSDAAEQTDDARETRFLRSPILRQISKFDYRCSCSFRTPRVGTYKSRHCVDRPRTALPECHSRYHSSATLQFLLGSLRLISLYARRPCTPSRFFQAIKSSQSITAFQPLPFCRRWCISR